MGQVNRDVLTLVHVLVNTASSLLYYRVGPERSLNKSRKHSLDISYQREIASDCYKFIAGGGKLSQPVLVKIVITYCIKKISL